MEEKKYRIIEWFNSIDGESKRSGELATFIRLAGCNGHCKWCDSKWSLDDNQGTEMTLNEIIEKAKKEAYPNITLTGGEPLIHKDVEDLIMSLAKLGFDIGIETNGSVTINDKKYYNCKNVWFSMDYKCPSSEMTDMMISALDMSYLRGCDTLKFVVADREDLDSALRRIKAIEELYNEKMIPDKDKCTYYFSPCFGAIELIDIVNFMKENNLNKRTKLQVQLHKLVWDPNERGV